MSIGNNSHHTSLRLSASDLPHQEIMLRNFLDKKLPVQEDA
jgi:hypothetical protein